MSVQPENTVLEHSWTVYCEVEMEVIGYVHEQTCKEDALVAAYDQFGPGNHKVTCRSTQSNPITREDLCSGPDKNSWLPWCK